MDNLTHTLAGAALGEAGLKRRTGLAMATLMIGANLPDLDVLAIPFGHSLAFRRGWTHGVLALFVLPFLLAGAMLAWDRWIRWRRSGTDLQPVRPRQILLLSFIAVFSHPLLDWLNTYGLRWLMPFDGTWFYGDALFIIDPWVWLVLLIGVVMARRRHRWGHGLAAAGITAVYAAFMLGSAAFGRTWVREAVRKEGITADRVMVGPVPANPFRRDVVIAEGDRYWVGDLHFRPAPELRLDPEPIPSNHDHPAAARARSAPEAAGFLTWTRFPFYVITPADDSVHVRLDDLRYSNGRSTSFASVRLTLPRPID